MVLATTIRVVAREANLGGERRYPIKIKVTMQLAPKQWIAYSETKQCWVSYTHKFDAETYNLSCLGVVGRTSWTPDLIESDKPLPFMGRDEFVAFRRILIAAFREQLPSNIRIGSFKNDIFTVGD